MSKQTDASLPEASEEHTLQQEPLFTPEEPSLDVPLPEASEEHTLQQEPLFTPEEPLLDVPLSEASEEHTQKLLSLPDIAEPPLSKLMDTSLPESLLDASESEEKTQKLLPLPDIAESALSKLTTPLPESLLDVSESEEETQKLLPLPGIAEPLAGDQTDESHPEVLLLSDRQEQSTLLDQFDEDTQKRLVVLKTSTRDRDKQKRNVVLKVEQLPVVVIRKIKRRGLKLKSFSSPRRGWLHALQKDPWFLLTLLVASFASILALAYFFDTHEILLLGDTYSHMLIARRLFDTLTPGLAQIGGVWLPLPHLLMVPFVWNDYLWNTGLAGSFVAMPCYIISACYIFLTARHLTHNNPASFVGTLVFILNPNVLYLQTTPLSELVLIATLAMAAYYYLLWASDDNIVNLIRAGACIFLATLARYDGWPVFLVMVVLIVVIGCLKRNRWSRIEAQLIIFSILGGLGIVLWCLWCYIIFKDPLYWQHSIFSSAAQQAALPQQLTFLHTKDVLFDYHNVLQSLRTYTLDSIYNVGLVPCILMAISILIFYLHKGLAPEKVAVLVVLIPFPFYIFSLFMGQAVIFVPHSAPPNATLGLNYYNVRYGIEMIAPAAIFVATLANKIWKWFSNNSRHAPSNSGKLAQSNSHPVAMTILVGLSLLIIAQSILVAKGGIINLQEGQFGFDCSPVDQVALFMVQHYNGGPILSDTFTSGTTALGAEAEIPFKNMIYEGSGALWVQALANPASTVDWVILNPDNSKDLVTRNLNMESPAFLSQFTLELREGNGIELFHRNNASALASKPVPDALLIAHRLCPTSL